MDKGIRLQKEIAMGSASAKKEASGPTPAKKVTNLKCGGKVKKASGGKAKKGCC